ncbi:MAG: cohesin domain-containing protein [Candidatus Bathyarchaeia archaeon]
MFANKKLLVTLTAIFIAAFYGLYMSIVSASPAITVQIVPSADEVTPGQTFHVNVTISNIESSHDLVGIEFKVKWNTTLLTAIKMELPPGHIFQAAEDDGNLWVIRKTVDNTAGEAWYMVTCNSLSQGYENGYLPLTGGGVICKITFNATQVLGTSPLEFVELPPQGLKIKLSNGQGQPILDYQVVESSLTVIPEFPSVILLISALLAVSAFYLARLKSSKLQN